jgi:hypothetical protein
MYVTIGDQIGPLFADVDFADLYAADGKPALSPNRLAMVVIFQFMEDYHDTILAARRRQETPAFRETYRRRAGIEGTISEAVNSHAVRRSRYVGLARTTTQALLTAIAINLKRVALWLMAPGPRKPRPARLTCLAPA